MNDIENPGTDKELIQNALQMWANWIETGNVVLSARDAQAQGKKHRALSEEGMALVLRLRKLAVDIDQKIAGNLGYSEIEAELSDLPATFYPALLNRLVEAAYRKKVFRKGQIHVWAKKAEDLCQQTSQNTPEPPKSDTSSPTNQTTTRSSGSSPESRRRSG